MPRSFSLDCFDVELIGRNTPDEWSRILALRDRPGFLCGLFRYAELMPAYFSDNVNLNKAVTEAWRFHMLVFALHLYDSRDPGDPASGLTLANLTRLCTQQRVASRGRVFAILGIMQLAGYLRRRRAESDSRVVHFEPSPQFIGIVEGWNHRILKIIDAIDETEGLEGLTSAHLAHSRFGWTMREHGAQTILAGWKVLDPFPEVAHFVYSDGGWMLLLACTADALRASGGAVIAPVSIDLAAFGKRFGVSRSHLRRLLGQAHAKGLLDAPPRNGQHIALSPHLVASFLTCMASELGNYRLWALAAKRELDGRAQLPPEIHPAL